MNKTHNIVFQVLRIIAWIIFIGLSIEAGGYLVNFITHFVNPSLLPKMYQKIDLTDIYQQSKWVFNVTFTFILLTVVLKAYLFYLVVMLMHRLDINQPFNRQVAHQIKLISYFALIIGLSSAFAQAWIQKVVPTVLTFTQMQVFWSDYDVFLTMGAIIYMIGAIFSRGVLLQEENELTV